MRIRTNNPLGQILREVRPRMLVVGGFADETSALTLVCARQRHIVGTRWGKKGYLNMEPLNEMKMEKQVAL